jgi:hypothetical protein
MPVDNNDIPMIDPRIEYTGATKLRSLNTENLRKLKKTLVIQDNDTPLAVLLNYEQYLTIQRKLQEALDRVQFYSKEEAQKNLGKGLKDIQEGRVVPLADKDPKFSR